MADSQLRAPNIGFVNSLRAVPGGLGTGSGLTTPLNYTSVGALRTALAAANGAYYTATKLNQMTVNDMVFALRSIQDSTTIADYLPPSAA